MGKTYRWTPDRWEERLAVKRGEDDWKSEYRKEMEQAMAERENEVFVIVNEWEDAHGNVGSSIIDGLWYASEGDALTELRTIAESVGVEIPEDEFGFTTEDSGTLNYDEYYIQELTRG